MAIYGAGGFAREVAPLLADDDDVVFVSDVPAEQGEIVNGIEVIGFDSLRAATHNSREVVIAVGSPDDRRNIARRCVDAGLRFGNICAATSRRLVDVRLGEGSIVCDYSLITANARIGAHFHLNIYSYVAHDCRVGDFVTFAPRVCCNGNVWVEDNVYVGTGAIIREGERGRPRHIGAGAVIGMGAVVTRDVAPGTTVVGVPARPVGAGDR